MILKNYYAALGIASDASAQGIQTAYRQLAKQWHPDHAGMLGKEKFQTIQEAYETLSDPSKRQQYDTDRAAQRRKRTLSRRAEALVPVNASSRTYMPEPLLERSHRSPLYPNRGIPFDAPVDVDLYEAFGHEWHDMHLRLMYLLAHFMRGSTWL